MKLVEKSLWRGVIVFDVVCEQASNYEPRAKKVKSWGVRDKIEPGEPVGE